MLAGHLSGVRRVGLNLQQTGALNRQLRLSSAYDVAIGFLKKRATLAAGQVTGLLKRYGQAALGGLGQLADKLANRISGTLSETLAAGKGVKDGVKDLRDAFTAEGIVPGNNYALENLFRTQTQLAYSAGRLSALADPAVDRVLWGYTFVTVGDDRVRETHAAMDGVTRPKEDQIWKIWQPPVGFNCRCSTLELFDEGTPTKDLPNVQPDKGFAFNPLDLVRDVGSTPPKRAA
jgi:SPP1 gp7 family putative phage head morphogenesis protein